MNELIKFVVLSTILYQFIKELNTTTFELILKFKKTLNKFRHSHSDK